MPTGKGGSISLINRPLDTVGVYVPAGTAPLPSSVLMNVVPARAAGVRKVIMCTPPRQDATMKRTLLAAAALAALVTLSGCATVAGTMIGTGVGTLAGAPFSGAMIGGGIGMLVDSR